MTKKNIVLTLCLVIMAAVWVIYFSGWFTKQNIEIMHNFHSQRKRAGSNNTSTAPVLSFGFSREYQLVELKVLSESALHTNAAPLPEWHLTSESNSVPLKMLIYGQWIQGMKPAVPNSRPHPLQPGQSYRLLVKTTTGQEGDYEFKSPD
ncbi:MAG TPA: hypothetical protein VH255_05695 [Verrucomicrobiae bacterium]|jgi:hypothetical protein|nr:hypothetical protein [Verrucomicrobiae bacterium]